MTIHEKKKPYHNVKHSLRRARYEMMTSKSEWECALRGHNYPPSAKPTQQLHKHTLHPHSLKHLWCFAPSGNLQNVLINLKGVLMVPLLACM